MKTTSTCLFCLHQKPEHVLHCGHFICDTCVCIFGRSKLGVEYHIDLDTCILCFLSVQLTVQLKSLTAGACLLCIDDGGTKEVISLKFLTALKRALNLSYSIQEHFDSVSDTSSGLSFIQKAIQLQLIRSEVLIILALFTLH